MTIQPYSSEVHLAIVKTSTELQLGRSIARYGLFDFLDSDRSSSNLLSIVESHLPIEIKNKVVNLMSKKRQDQLTKSSGWKRNLLRGIAILLPGLPPLLQTVGAVLGLPGTVLLKTLKLVGSDQIWTDPNWGSTTVKTESFNGDLAWSTRVSIGTPPQEFRLNIDSGSADLFLFSPNCTSCSLSNHTAYIPSKSYTSSHLNHSQAFSQTFGDGSTIEGNLAIDIVTLGNLTQIHNQSFGLATKISTDWAALAVDGLMGIGPESNSIFNGTNSMGFFRQLVDSKMLAIPVIGIAFVSPRNGDHSPVAGEFTFGGVSEKWIRGGRGNLAWKNVTSKNFWGVSLTGIFVNGQNVMSSQDPPRAILDTGTSLTIVSKTTASAIHNTIPGAIMNVSNGIWKVPCSIHNAYNLQDSYISHNLQDSYISKRSSSEGFRSVRSPNIFFEFGSQSDRYAIPAESLAYQGVKKDSRLVEDGLCYSGIQAGSNDFVVLGDTFIKNQYLALRYDPDGQRSVGLGKRTDLPYFT